MNTSLGIYVNMYITQCCTKKEQLVELLSLFGFKRLTPMYDKHSTFGALV